MLPREKRKKLAYKLYEERKDVIRSVPSGRYASWLAWDLLELFEKSEDEKASITGRGITEWKYGRYLSRKEADFGPFSFEYIHHKKRIYINFRQDGDTRTAEQRRRDDEMEEKKAKIIPSHIDKLFKQVGDISERSSDQIKVICRLFNAGGTGEWYLYDREDDGDTYWCFANLGMPEFSELGTVSINELISIKGMFDLGVERDRHFPENEVTLKEIMNKIQQR